MTLPYRNLLSWNYNKLGPEIAIINTSTATDCPCQDVCKDREICYAKTTEHFRPYVLEKNARQAELFKTLSLHIILDCIDHFLQIPSGQKIKYLRWNSFGDWPSTGILAKAAIVSMEIKRKYNIDSYCYTRSEAAVSFLKEAFRNHKRCSIITWGHDFQGLHGITATVPSSFKQGEWLPEGPAQEAAKYGYHLCPGDCQKCGYHCMDRAKLEYESNGDWLLRNAVLFRTHGAKKSKWRPK